MVRPRSALVTLSVLFFLTRSSAISSRCVIWPEMRAIVLVSALKSASVRALESDVSDEWRLMLGARVSVALSVPAGSRSNASNCSPILTKIEHKNC